MDTVIKLLIERGFFPEKEFFTKLKQVQANYLSNGKNNGHPVTVEESVALLMEDLSFSDRTIIANMKEDDLGILDFAFRKRAKGEFGLGSGNAELLQSCRFGSGQPPIDLESALAFIIKCLGIEFRVPVLKVVK